ncbi:MAG TPA: sorbosone dehydrogenase family protein [Pseudomonas sabulinigri]|nr:sorbosone dehydrogenase family protein [Halopseudomonas sabulinigri]HEC51504.1 sorbosone dehydrogenase family protein [Halopseudomonas sabulinigri]
MGPHPALPEPQISTLPTVNIAPAVGWQGNARPQVGKGLQVQPFAQGLDHPRWLHVLPNGDVLVAETNAPAKPEGSGGVKDWMAKRVMSKAGAVTPSADRISLLRDTDGDGVADQRTVFLDNLNSPFGMALVGNTLYVANTDSVVRFPYRADQTQITATGEPVTALPGGPLNHHWTKNLIASPNGSKLYAAVGSNSNVAENGLDQEQDRAAIWEIDPSTGNKRLYASGLRNPVGMAWEPYSGELWTVVNERDELGNDLVPDYMTSVQDGGFYGWPWSYYGQHEDQRVSPKNPAMVAKALVPDYALGAHTASLGLSNAVGSRLPAPFTEGLFIGQHGSWNREPHSGYKVLFVPFKEGRPNDAPYTVLDGFLNAKGEAQGRPVGVAIDGQGALLVADDVGNVIWRVSAASQP